MRIVMRHATILLRHTVEVVCLLSSKEHVPDDGAFGNMAMRILKTSCRKRRLHHPLQASADTNI